MYIKYNLTSLNALSPLDGRYFKSIYNLRNILSEYSFILYRIEVEIIWIISLSEIGIPEINSLNFNTLKKLLNLIENFSELDALRIKEIENITKHDVKSIEYWIKEVFSNNAKLTRFIEFIHFSCTSEDINNVAYSLMLIRTKENIVIPYISKIKNILKNFCKKQFNISMLSRTHGQPAVSTKLSKEFLNIFMRIKKIFVIMTDIYPLAKLNGATGNYNAHIISYPEINWLKFSKSILNKLGLEQNVYTTQIEPHDYMINFFNLIFQINSILIDLNRDIWGYISLGYFKQNFHNLEIGSSTMPQKINPIDFENSEGNLGLANAILNHFSIKLPISRWQRDLSDSTVLRNLSSAIGYSLLSWISLIEGLNKLIVDESTIYRDINSHWEILTEPIQIIMKRFGIYNSYETLKNFSMGKKINKKILHEFIKYVNLSDEYKIYLINVSPRSYTGIAKKLSLKNF